MVGFTRPIWSILCLSKVGRSGFVWLMHVLCPGEVGEFGLAKLMFPIYLGKSCMLNFVVPIPCLCGLRGLPMLSLEHL